jgi:hypothetical protein
LIKNKIIHNNDIDFYIREEEYGKAISILFEQQLKKWSLLKERYDALDDVKIKEFRFDGSKIKVQYNPGRIKSSSAKTDDVSINNRTCFLCIENLPDPQQGILLADKYLLLCNPFPIFPQHFTISSEQHEPQFILNHLEGMLEITKQLSSDYSLIYNGPACGASAPDHFHFQTVRKNSMPIEDDYHQLKNEYGKFILDNEKLMVTSVDDGLRRFLVIESTEMKKNIKAFKIFYKAYAEISSTSTEPMFNIISTYNAEYGWSLILFLRDKHRPELFYKEGDDKILISPATVDLGGVLIAPQEIDFKRIDKILIRKVFKEVSLNDEAFLKLNKKLEEIFN